MTAIVITLALGSLPACYAITAAHRAGANSWRGRCVWAAEALADGLIRWARQQREYAEWREQRERREA